MNEVKEKVVIIIPTYNEGPVIAETLKALLRETDLVPGYEVSILVFDSQSTDDCVAEVKALQDTTKRLFLASEPKKTGLGSAYLKAMHYAMDKMGADVVIEFDADGSHKPCYILPMLDMLKRSDVVIGSRYIPKGSIPADWGLHRKLLSRLGNYVARLVLTTKYKDLTSGFRATRTRLLKKVLPKRFLSPHYAYKLQLVWLLHQQGANIKELPIHFIDRKKGYSKLPTNSIIDSLYVVFTLRYLEMKRYIKMCAVGLLGAVVHFGMYNLMRMHYSPVVSIQCATVSAMLSNYLFNTHFTFKGRQTHLNVLKLKRFSLYIAYSILLIGIQSSWMHFATRHISHGRLAENIFLFVGMVLISVMNFQFYSRFIWPEVDTDTPPLEA